MKSRQYIKLLSGTIEMTMYVLVICIMAVFGYTGLDKAINLPKFQEGLSNSPFIPYWVVGPTTTIAIVTMLATPILLLIGFWRAKFMELGLWASMGLMIVFTVYVAAIITVAPYRPCTCIGLDERLGLGWNAHLFLNITLLASVWTLLVLHYTNKIFNSHGETGGEQNICCSRWGTLPAPKNGK